MACAPPPEGAFLEQIHPVIALCSDDVSFLFHINAAARKKNDERIMRKGQNDIGKQSVNDTHTNNAWPRGESIQVAGLSRKATDLFYRHGTLPKKHNKTVFIISERPYHIPPPSESFNFRRK